MVDPEVKRAQIQKLVKWGVIAAGAAITAPLAYMMLEGVIMWGVLIGTMAVVTTFAPAVGDWLANKKVQAIMAVAAANPIETMQNLYLDKSNELKHKQRDITEFDTGIRDFKNQIIQVKKDYPEEAADYDQMLSQEQTGLDQMKEEYQESANALTELQKQINKAQVLYKLALTALRVASLNKTQEAAFFQDMKKKVAFDTVMSTVNKSFAALDSSVMARKSRTLTFPSKPEVKQLPEAVIEGQVIPAPQVRALSEVVRRA